MFDAIDDAWRVGARSLSRSQLRHILVEEKGLSAEVWALVAELLEYAERARFAGDGAESEARQRLSEWVDRGEALCRKLKG